MAYDIGPFDGEHAGARKLLALADYLETVPDNLYNHSRWKTYLGDGPEAGCAMCALGHGADALPHIIGLSFGPASEGLDRMICRSDGSDYLTGAFVLASEAFDISLREALAMFGSDPMTMDFYGVERIWQIKPKRVAERIRAFALAKLAQPVEV